MTPDDSTRKSPSGAPLAPAATVACLRVVARGLEVLMLRRNAKLAFHGGAWVFPGGRVDPEDLDGPDADLYALAAARTAAAREAHEEAAVQLDASALVTLSHWTTPPGRPRRFATWFFLGELKTAIDVRVDGEEIAAHRWMSPSAVLAGQARGELTLPPPTFVTLTWLAQFSTAEQALQAASQTAVERFVPRPVPTEWGVASLYAGDAGYENRNPDAAGARHRLSMGKGAWRYERSAAGLSPMG